MSVSLVDIKKHRWNNLITSTLLIVGISCLLMVAVHLFFRLSWGSSLITVTCATLFSFFGPKISPSVVLKMYKAREVRPDQEPALLAAFAELSQKAQLEHIPRLYYIPSRLPNAFAIGTDRLASVAVTDGLFRSLSRRELLAVLAHEIAHIRHHDLYLLGVADSLSRMTSLVSRLGLMLAILWIPFVLFGGKGFGFWGLAFLILAPTISSLLQLALSRSREYDADIGAVSLTGDPEGLASALFKIEKMVKPTWWQQIFVPGDSPEPACLRTHPPTKDRIHRLMELKARNESQTDPLELPSIDWIEHSSQSRSAPNSLRRIRERPKWHLNGLRY